MQGGEASVGSWDAPSKSSEVLEPCLHTSIGSTGSRTRLLGKACGGFACKQERDTCENHYQKSRGRRLPARPNAQDIQCLRKLSWVELAGGGSQ
ncbi:hypothetical protein Y1Q_0005921 [Alligator mississippiensis]|uniref:Uncharacterized protein n=1 Tax=Alligator mississippiensis TaxID=8496 RepID=A0A151P676_ALLMI|nr:hypothetical protein Y1Q_0005921 [Alligator mississippiensis]